MILVGIAFSLLFWNEGRAVKRYRTLKEGVGTVVSIVADRVDPANQGKLVHLSGLADTEETIADQAFRVSARAIKLLRVAEMYQWQQESRSEQKKKLGGGTETVTTYSYNRVWSDRLIDSDGFKQPEGHRNPGQQPYSSKEIADGTVMVGAFTLPPSLITKIRNSSSLSLGSDFTLPENLAENARLMEDTIYIGPDWSRPRVGDTRVSFQVVQPQEISLVAAQVNSTLEPYRAGIGGTIELLEPGIHRAEAMFQQAQKSNTILTWILRGAGFLIMFIGLQMMLGPLAVFADVLPILGSIVGVGTGLIAALIAGILSSLTVAVAWFVYRPVPSMILLVIAAAGGVIMFARLRGKAPAGEATAAVPPPPPPPGGRQS